MKKVLLIICSTLLTCLNFNFAEINKDAGTKGNNFLKFFYTARNISLGGAFVAVRGDVESLNSNPSLLACISEYQVNTTYNSWFADTNCSSILLGSPLGLGIGLGYFNYGELTRVVSQDDYGIPIEEGTFTANDVMVVIGYGRKFKIKFLENDLLTGMSLRTIWNIIDNSSVNNFSIDLGLNYEIIDGLTTGLSILNLGIAEQIKLGAMKKFVIRKEDSLLSSIEIEKPVDQNIHFLYGIEYGYKNLVFFRIGYRGNYDTDWLTIGIGGVYKNIKIDYAYCPFNILGVSHRISLSFNYNGKLFLKR